MENEIKNAYEIISEDNTTLDVVYDLDDAFRIASEFNAAIKEVVVVDSSMYKDIINFKRINELLTNTNEYQIGYDEHGYVTHLYKNNSEGVIS